MNAKICAIMLIGLSIMTISMISSANATSIGIFTLQPQISKTDDILVTGFVDAESSYIPVKLQVYDPNGNLIFRPDVSVNKNGQFSWLFHPPFGIFDTIGTYTVIASHKELDETATIQFTVVEDTNLNNNRLENTRIESNFDDSKQPDTIQKHETINANVQKDPSQQTIELSDASNKQDVQNTESPIMAIMVAISIAGVASGIVIWIRSAYSKPIIQK